MLEAVIFDMDGVISDSERFYVGIKDTVLAHFGITDVPYEYHMQFMGTTHADQWKVMSKDFHKPALDGIGYEDSLNNYRAWWTARLLNDNVWKDTAAGKTVAWINYMTNFNKTFGNFASGESESFMCLNRNYERNESDNTIEDLTTYIDPSKHNEIFADTNIDAMNFWIQTAVRAQVRRNISAKQIPNL